MLLILSSIAHPLRQWVKVNLRAYCTDETCDTKFSAGVFRLLFSTDNSGIFLRKYNLLKLPITNINRTRARVSLNKKFESSSLLILSSSLTTVNFSYNAERNIRYICNVLSLVFNICQMYIHCCRCVWPNVSKNQSLPGSTNEHLDLHVSH